MRFAVNSATKIAALAGMVALATPLAANATLISIGESLSATGPITTMGTDGGGGYVSASGSMGSFTLTSATATGSPLLAQPTLDTASIDVSSAGSGTLYIYVTQQGLTTPQGVSNFLSSFTFNLFNGSGIASVTEKTFISTTNALYSGTLLSSATDSSGGLSTSSSTAASPTISGVFSETIEYIIKATGVGSTNDTVNLSSPAVPVPEPASLWVLAACLGFLSILVRGRRAS